MRRILMYALFALAAMGSRATAEQTLPDSVITLTDSIVVTADRFGSAVGRSVWPATVLTSEHLADQPSIARALDGRAGIDIRSYNGDGSLSTLSNWGAFNRHVLLLYDGRPVKDYSLGGFNLSEFSLDELERIEIVKGPQSAIYGSDAIGGVVNLISSSSFGDRIGITTHYGSFGLRQYRLDGSYRLGRIGLSGSGEFHATDNGRDNAGVERNLMGFRTDYLSRDARHHITISGRFFKDSLGVPGPVPDPTSVPVYGSGESFSLTSFQEDENYSVDGHYTFNDNQYGQVRVDMFWEKKNLDYRSLYNYQFGYVALIDSSGMPFDTTFGRDSVDVHSGSSYDKRSAGVNARYKFERNRYSLSGGVDFLSGGLRSESNDSSRATTIGGPFAGGQYAFTSANSWSAGQDQVDFWSAGTVRPGGVVGLSYGGRLQFVKNRTVQPSYNVALSWEVSEGVFYSMGYGYSFRLPTLAEQFARDIWTTGSDDLDPEIARTFSATIRTDLSGQGEIRVTLFRQRIESLIQYDFTVFPALPQNRDELRSDGVDVNLAHRIGWHLDAELSGVWQSARQTRDANGHALAADFVPELKWRAFVRSSWGRYGGDISLAHTSDRTLLYTFGGLKTIESVYELDVRLSARITELVRLSLGLYDLTDQARADQFGFSPLDRDYPGLGRRAVITLRAGIR